jgi:phage tail protein X
MDPSSTAAHLAAARVAALTGDQAAVQRNAEAIAEDMRRAMKMPDATRPIDHESARSVARAMPDVVSAAWLDRSNFLVRVRGAKARSERTIDELCYRLESLGDTLAVVVHLQNAKPQTPEEGDTLSRNCQLPMGDNAFMQTARKVDVVDPAVRAQQRANAELERQRPQRVQTDGDRAALQAIPEM